MEQSGNTQREASIGQRHWSHRLQPATQERFPVIVLISPLEQLTTGAQEGGPNVAFKEITDLAHHMGTRCKQPSWALLQQLFIF